MWTVSTTLACEYGRHASGAACQQKSVCDSRRNIPYWWRQYAQILPWDPSFFRYFIPSLLNGYLVSTFVWGRTQVTHSQRLEMNFEENKTVMSYFSCSLWSLLGFWVVLEPLQLCSIFFLLPLRARGRTLKKIIITRNGSKTTQKSRRDDNEQIKYDLTVLCSSIFIFNLREWVTCGQD